MLPSLYNGKFSESVSLEDRALQFGDGLFETMRVEKGAISLLERHLDRLLLGCERLKIDMTRARLERELEYYDSLVTWPELAALKLIVSRGCTSRGYASPENTHPSLIIKAQAYELPRALLAEDGIRLHLCQTRLSRNPMLAGMKHLNRLEQVLARHEWEDPSIVEGLVRDTEGYVIEGVSANLFAWLDGRWCTPTLDLAGVKGVMRQELIESVMPALGMAVEESRLSLRDIDRAQELFVCNSMIGVVGVKACGEMSWAVGSQTRALIERVRGRV